MSINYSPRMLLVCLLAAALGPAAQAATLEPVGLSEGEMADIGGITDRLDQTSDIASLPAEQGGAPDNSLVQRDPGEKDGGDRQDFLQVTALNLREVPLPAALWLFGSALLALVMVSRRRREFEDPPD